MLIVKLHPSITQISSTCNRLAELIKKLKTRNDLKIHNNSNTFPPFHLTISGKETNKTWITTLCVQLSKIYPSRAKHAMIRKKNINLISCNRSLLIIDSVLQMDTNIYLSSNSTQRTISDQTKLQIDKIASKLTASERTAGDSRTTRRCNWSTPTDTNNWVRRS